MGTTLFFAVTVGKQTQDDEACRPRNGPDCRVCWHHLRWPTLGRWHPWCHPLHCRSASGTSCTSCLCRSPYQLRCPCPSHLRRCPCCPLGCPCPLQRPHRSPHRDQC